MSAFAALPLGGNLFISVSDHMKPQIAELAKGFHELGFQLYTTRGTGRELEKEDIPFVCMCEGSR